MHEPQEDLRRLSTEHVGSEFQQIDNMTSLELVTLINSQDQTVASAVSAALPQISRAVDLAVESLHAGGRIVYVGAGTSGRLGVLDAAECGPTFNAADSVVAIIAGGPQAMVTAAEGAEDDREAAIRDLGGIGLQSQDVVIGISASGRTPYVASALSHAHAIGCRTVSISSNREAMLSALADCAIEVETGPEVIAGSTRMKAATAQKMILNMLSSASMVRIGKTFGNMMADLRISNEKLLSRGVSIVAQVTAVSEEAAAAALQANDLNVRRAVEALRSAADSPSMPQAG